MKNLRTLLLAGLCAIILNSCKKYEEGGLIGKTEKHLKQSWTLESYLRNGVDETSQLHISNYEETYAETESFSRSYTDKNGKNMSENGSWKWDEEQKKLNISGVSSMDITPQTGTVSSSYFMILKLDKNEFWYYYTNGSDRHEFHLKKK